MEAMIQSQEEGEEEFWLGLLGEVDSNPHFLDSSKTRGHEYSNTTIDNSLNDESVDRDDNLLDVHSSLPSPSHLERNESASPKEKDDECEDICTASREVVNSVGTKASKYYDVDLDQSTSLRSDAFDDAVQNEAVGDHGRVCAPYTAPSSLRYQRQHHDVPGYRSYNVWGNDGIDSGDDEDSFRDRLEFVFCQRACAIMQDSDADALKMDSNRSERSAEISADRYWHIYEYLLHIGAFTVNTTSSLTNILYGNHAPMIHNASVEDGEECDPVDGFIEAARNQSNDGFISDFLIEFVQPTSAKMLDWKDMLVAKVTWFVHSNVYLASIIGCVHQSTLLMSDRLQGLAAYYLHKLQGDDPERIHLDRLQDAPDWQHLLLRCSMATLTWKQRQMLEITRDGGFLSGEELREMMSRELEEYDRARVMKVATEYFYFLRADGTAECLADSTDAHNNHSGADTMISNIKSGDGVGSESLVSNIHAWLVSEAESGSEDAQYFLARFFTAPYFQEEAECSVCRNSFGITLFRHHCRFCGCSVCHIHSLQRRRIFRYGMVQPVRVCDTCCEIIDETQRRDLLLWKNLRVESFLKQRLIPYFHPAVDRSIDKAIRIADYSMMVAKKTLMFNFPAKVALDAVDVLRRYGLAGLTGLLLRQDFMESVETLKRISGMEEMFSSFSLHELTACIYYKLAIERGLRGCNPDNEHELHISATCISDNYSSAVKPSKLVESNVSNCAGNEKIGCRFTLERDIDIAIRFSPLALHFVYEDNTVDCQRLAKQQGWDMIFTNIENELEPEQPCYALFGEQHADGDSHSSARVAVLAIRGTQTVQDVVTDIRAAPMHFPPAAEDIEAALRGESTRGRDSPTTEYDSFGVYCSSGGEVARIKQGSRKTEAERHWDWLNLPNHRNYTCGGMLRAAMYVLHEVGPALVRLHKEGYHIKLVGHSLGGAVAALITYLLIHGGYSSNLVDKYKDMTIQNVTCITYGCPSCVDAETSEILRDSVLSVVLGDDAISRVTPQSLRLLLRELMVFREQMFKHLQQDWGDVMERAANMWSPRLRSVPDFSAHHINSLKPSSSDKSSLQDDTSIEPGDHDAIKEPTDNTEINSGGTEDAIIIDEDSLKALWLPGRIVHLYRYRGQWRGAEVERDFPSLRFITIQGNMFEDHCSDQITNALLEVRSVIRLNQQQSTRSVLPKWIAFNESNACACCSNSFTWNSTFRGEAQEYRDRNNCNFCGRLVCGPCSMQSRVMPQLGFIFPRRICDQCVMKGDFASPI